MHNHNPDKDDSWMMWMMVICCAIPLILLLILGFGGKNLGASNWLVLGGVGLMVLFHFLIMGKSHKSHRRENEEINSSSTGKATDNKDHSGHSCCH